MKILVVDDDWVIREMLSQILEDTGEYEVEDAENGLDGWEKFQSVPGIELIISDMIMPILDGLELIKRVRGTESTVPIIILTAGSEMSVAIDAINHGANDYLLKDESMKDTVLLAVQKVMEMNRIAEKNRNLMQELAVQNEKLAETLKELQFIYDDLNVRKEQLIQSEKMASLGRLVAGVAHEINTPVGVCMTAITTFARQTRKIATAYGDRSMKRSDLEQYFKWADENNELIYQLMDRTGDLVRSFKMVSADQASQERRLVNMKQYINDVLASLKPRLISTAHKVELDCPDNIEINSFPGAIAQVFTNLIMNSLLHAFDETDHGIIRISASLSETGDWLILEYQDDGKGIPSENLPKVFDPFFTTRRNQGGTGLGLNVVYNLVTGPLKGSITCESTEGVGVKFFIRLAVSKEDTSDCNRSLPPLGLDRHPRGSGDPCFEVTGFPPSRE